MENTSLIKVHSFYLKNVFNLYEKIGNYFWDNPTIRFGFMQKSSFNRKFIYEWI